MSKIYGRAACNRISARESETGDAYWCVTLYERQQGMWAPAHTAVSFAASEAEARRQAVALGLGEMPMLGAPECCLDGQVRGREHARRRTGADD